MNASHFKSTVRSSTATWRCPIGQVADSGLVETNEGRDAQSVAHRGEAFMPAEAGYQDEERDEWTINTDDVETV